MGSNDNKRVIARFDNFYEEDETWDLLEVCNFCKQQLTFQDEGPYYGYVFVDWRKCWFCNGKPEWHPYIPNMEVYYLYDHPRYDWEYLVYNVKKNLGINDPNGDDIPF